MQSGCGNAYQRQIVHQIEIQSMHSGMLYHDPRVLFKLTQISFNISWRKAGSSGGERKQSHPHRIKAERDRRVMNKVPNQVGQNASADGHRKTPQGQKETLLGILLQMIFRPLWLQFPDAHQTLPVPAVLIHPIPAMPASPGSAWRMYLGPATSSHPEPVTWTLPIDTHGWLHIIIGV